MSFALRMAWKDSRASRRRLLMYSSTIVLGIAALVSVGSFGENVKKTLGNEPQMLLAADLRVGLSQWPVPGLENYLGSAGITYSKTKTFSSPLSGKGENAPRRAVQVKAVDGAFPLYGSLGVTPRSAMERFRKGERVAFVDQKLLDQFHVALGDTIKLNAGSYEVVGLVDVIPGDPALLFNVQAQAVVPWDTANLAPKDGKPALKGNYRLFLKLPDGMKQDDVATEIKNRTPDAFPVIMTSDRMKKNIDDALTQVSRFFQLVVFVALFLGAIGVASALHVYVQERLGTVAILRCLGASAGEATLVYLAQAAGLGACGAIGGGILGLGIQRGLPYLVQDFLPVHLDVFFAPWAVASGMVEGFLICLVFTLLPLLPIRRVSPLATLRSGAETGPRVDPAQVVAWILIAASVAGFAYWQARNVKVMVGYTLLLGVSFGFFAGIATVVSLAAKHWFPRFAPFVIRQGVANLHRPRNRTRLLLLALGMGIYLVLTIYLVHSTLMADFGGESMANLVLSNVQDADANTVLALAKGEKMRVVRDVRMVRIQLETVNGKPPAPRSILDHGAGGFQAAARGELMPYESLDEGGSFEGKVKPGSPIIPITVGRWLMGRRVGFKIGDEAVWNVGGVPIRTKIIGSRAADGMHLEPNVGVQFPLGAIDDAPMEHVVLLRSANAASTARIEKALGTEAPRVQVFDLASLLETIDRVFSKVALVVDFIAFFTVATGMVILAAAVITGRHQRARESVLLRSLGATRGQLRWIQFTEYATLGLLSAVIGCGLATAADAAIAHYALKMPFGGWGLDVVATALAITAVTVATGVFADRGLSKQPPLEILRQET